MWIVLTPEKEYDWYTLSYSRIGARAKQVGRMVVDWEKLYRRGYRCIKVTITEGWEAGEV